MSKKVVFKIDKDGNVKIDEINGYGSGCADLTKFMEKRLGQPMESTRKFTEEYNEPIEADNQEHLRH